MRALEAFVPAELRQVVSPRVGIVTSLEECMVDVDEPRLVRIACEIAAGEELIGLDLGSAHNVGGSGTSRAGAVGAAVGEAVERYSAAYIARERLVEATAAELGPAAVDPATFGLFSAAQYSSPGFPYRPFTSDTRVPWVDGVDLITGETVWLPAELVFLADVRPGAAGTIGYATSSGLACGTSADDALERALFELLERDAFMLAWRRRLSPPHLDWSGHPELQAIDDRCFRPTGVRCVALDLSSLHSLPIVVGVVLAPGSGAALGVGAAANARVEDAWSRALAEAFASRSACRKLRLLDPERRYDNDGSDVAGFDDHIRFYGDDERADQAAFLWESSDVRPVSDVESLPGEASGRRAALVARIELAGSRAFAVDVTSPDVAAAGLHVIRAVAPGLAALDAAHPYRFLGAPRLLEPLPQQLSGRDILTPPVLTTDDLNALPHPFP
ncbi:MAG: YcaO-like family protein [Gaiellaceae bacterium]